MATLMHSNELYDVIMTNTCELLKKALNETNNEQTTSININMIPNYNQLTTYDKGQIIRYNDVFYVCINSNVSGEWDTAKWKMINEGHLKKKHNKIDKKEKLKRKRC